MPISGFVLVCNRAALLGTCLRSLRFVDEPIVIDKSSTDESVRMAKRYPDRVVMVPWHPTVEETRSLALEQCRHDWIVVVAMLRAIYDMVDRVKGWETECDFDGATAFRRRYEELDRAYSGLEFRLGIPTGLRGGWRRRMTGLRPC